MAAPNVEYGAMQSLVNMLASGELRGAPAFDAVVELIAQAEMPPEASAQVRAQIRDDIVLGVSNDRALCEYLYADPNPPRAYGEPPPGQGPSAGEPGTAEPSAVEPIRVGDPEGIGALADFEPPLPARPEAEEPFPVPAPPRAPVTGPTPALPKPFPRPRPPARRSKSRRRLATAAEDDDAGVQVQGRHRILTAVGIVAGVGALAAAYYGLKPGPCDELANRVCLELAKGLCLKPDVSERLAEGGIDDEQCSATLELLNTELDGVSPDKHRAVFGRVLVETIGFDPLKKPGAAAAAKVAAPPKPPPGPVAVVSGQPGMTSLFVGRANLYWTLPQPPGTYRVPSVGGVPEALGSHPDPVGVVATNNYVYWLSRAPTGGVVWVDKKRGSDQPFTIDLLEHSPTMAVFLGGQFAFVDATTGGVFLTDVDPPAPRRLSVEGTRPPVALDGDRTHVAWLSPGPDGSVVTTPRAEAGQPQVLARGLQDPRALALDATHVYYIDQGAQLVARVPRAGGQVENVAQAQAGPTEIVVDDSHVWWTNTVGGTVMMLPKTGGQPSALATGQTRPTLLAVDAAAVYWESDGSVMRMPKPAQPEPVADGA